MMYDMRNAYPNPFSEGHDHSPIEPDLKTCRSCGHSWRAPVTVCDCGSSDVVFSGSVEPVSPLAGIEKVVDDIDNHHFATANVRYCHADACAVCTILGQLNDALNHGKLLVAEGTFDALRASPVSDGACDVRQTGYYEILYCRTHDETWLHADHGTRCPKAASR